MPTKRHTVATIAAELLAKYPTLTEEASVTLARTLLRSLLDAPWFWPNAPIDTPVPTEDRTKVMRKAKSLYL